MLSPVKPKISTKPALLTSSDITFAAKETDFDPEKADFVQKETDAKRYTYVLGPNESCRTPGDRFYELSQKKNNATINDVETAFSVEKLSKEFFTKYKQHYENFVNYLIGSDFYAFSFNKDDKAIRDFVKIMLGRIVFLQFVQKKKWLGASNTEYKDGNPFFMSHFWETSGKQDIFYSNYLVRLFDALNTHRKEDAFQMPDGTIVRMPYLGGGLFEKGQFEPDILTFPAQLFDSLFSFFSEYNFTIDENDPDENEVGIDPEMLGHIFENLLEDNKDKGAFYTPKPIVKYMCQESLIQYLITAFEEKGVINDEPTKEKLIPAVERFVRKYEAESIIEYDNILSEALYKVKVCDPAIGSGAFPMGILNEMMMMINTLHNASPDVVQDKWQMNDWQPATVKKHIIQHSIYGVDIEKGAVDIARLRFWLSLIIDEEKPSTLPSLDYKIMQGNSLLESFEDIDLSKVAHNNIQIVEPERDLFGNIKESQMKITFSKSNLVEEIQSLIKEYFNIKNHTRKNEIKQQIDELVTQHIIFNLELRENQLKRRVSEVGSPDNLKKAARKKYNNWIKELENFDRKKEALLEIQKTDERPYFLWHLYFMDVFEQGGFDIVIGNPPYVSAPTMVKTVSKMRDEIINSQRYSTLYQKWDLYIPFMELGLQLDRKSVV